MKYRPKISLLIVACMYIFNTSICLASGSEHDKSAETEEIKGPQGGKVFTKDNFSIEVTIFESGVPPEMRLYVYQNHQLISPQNVKVEVTLERLGGSSDLINFSPEDKYLVGDIEVVEPHSFDVSINANFKNKRYQWRYENHEGRAEISDRLLSLSDIKTEKINPTILTFIDTLYGVISIPQDKSYKLYASYEGLVKRIHVQLGEKVVKDQKLATLQNSQSLQEYYLQSPAEDEVTSILMNSGERADKSALIEIIDLSKVWVDLSAFPENIERLAVGQKVKVYDLHHHKIVESNISYISPQMTGGHIARARAVMENLQGHWRPGMHVKADIKVKTKQVNMAIKETALQSFRDMPVVFAKFGNTFEVRMVELGESDGEYIEVISGIKPGTEYVTSNSFLLKAEVLKDGASHDH